MNREGANHDDDSLMSCGAKIDGTLNVIVEKGVKVLRHNAQNDPSRHGLFGEYSWRIRSHDADPCIIVQPAE